MHNHVKHSWKQKVSQQFSRNNPIMLNARKIIRTFFSLHKHIGNNQQIL